MRRLNKNKYEFRRENFIYLFSLTMNKKLRQKNIYAMKISYNKLANGEIKFFLKTLRLCKNWYLNKIKFFFIIIMHNLSKLKFSLS